MVQAAVAIGGNLGDVPAMIEAACAELVRHAEISELRCSGLFRSAPMGTVAGETFWNAACVFETSLDPHALLAELQRVENLSGRTREVHWGPRTLDLDLILYGDETVESETLTVPHPHFWYRGFVLEPLAELIPDVVPPGFALTIRDLAERLRQRPFRLGFSGDVEEPALRSVIAEFSAEHAVDIELVDLRTQTDSCGKPVSLAVGFGPIGNDELPIEARLLRCKLFDAQHLTDILKAACGLISKM